MKNRGFTLVEMAIVLVLIGLLISGVLVGQSLIHSAQLRAVSTEFSRYQTAMGAFKDKFFYLPGDMPNAVKYWGSAHGSTPTDLADGSNPDCDAIVVPFTGTSTCNGNGNGKFDGATEAFLAWQHLANAGLVEGAYDGNGGPDTALSAGKNVGFSKFKGGAWVFWGAGSADGATNLYAGTYNAVLLFTATVGDETAMNPILSPIDMHTLDRKMDDGKPGSGILLAPANNGAQPGCVTGDYSQYLTSSEEVGCSGVLITGY